MSSPSEYSAVARDAKRRGATLSTRESELSSGRPGSPLEDARQRELELVQAEASADELGGAVEQRDGEGAPFDDHGGADVVRLVEERFAGRDENAAVHEEPAV